MNTLENYIRNLNGGFDHLHAEVIKARNGLDRRTIAVNETKSTATTESFIQIVFKQHSNHRCADCNVDSTCIRMDLGITLCQNCERAHRQALKLPINETAPVPHFKVKANKNKLLPLPTDLQLLVCVGNDTANAILEQQLQVYNGLPIRCFSRCLVFKKSAFEKTFQQEQ